MENLGQKIVELRRARDITQVDLANRINVTKAMMSKYENNINVPKADVLGRIALALATTTDYLLGLEDALPDTAPDGKVRLHGEEFALLKLYRGLSDGNKARVHERALALTESQEASQK